MSDENPWESAANDRLYERQQEQEVSADDDPLHAPLLRSSNNTTTTTLPYSSSSSIFWTLPYNLDICLALLVGGYAGYCLVTEKTTKGDNRDEIWYTVTLALVVCGLGIVRGLLAARHQSSISMLYRMIRSSHWMTGILFAGVGTTVWIFHKWKNTPFAILNDLLPWSHTKHPELLPGVLVGLGLWEGLRYVLIKWMIEEDYSITLDDHHDPNNTSRSSSHGTGRRSNPWWWGRNHNNNNNNNQSLLDANGTPHWTSEARSGYEVEHGIEASNSSSWWPFRSRRNSTSNNPRDDGSVDYASLSEDWASRSQDDPFWWTKEGGGGGNNNNGETANPTWASAGANNV